MELWIRTQDKENIIKLIDQCGLKYNDKKTIIANFEPDFTDRYDGFYEILGTYKSKERALEVLDEIQEIIDHLNDPNLYVSTFVYEMPKD